MSKIKNSLPKPEKTFICPLTDIKYAGMCPVLNCPANITKLNKPSGCIHGFLNYKREIGINELSYIFEIEPKEVRRRIEYGENEIQKVLIFYDILTRLRDNYKVKYNCPKCGVLRSTYGDCINKVQCTDRLNFIERLLKEKPFCIPDLNMNKSDMFLIFNNKEKINNFLKNLTNAQTTKPLKFSSLLGLSRDDDLFLLEMKTLV
jgi:hypothetical protein